MYKQYQNSDYDIYDDGRCYSHKTNKFLKPQMSQKYPTYNLSLPSGKRKVKIHRMVAETFIDNPDNKPIVNHKDGNTHNFSQDNLEWATHSENNIHAHQKGLRPIGDRVAQYYIQDLENEEWKQISNFSNYLISNYGRVMNIRTKRLLKPAKSNAGGYYEVSLWKNNKGQTIRVHVLVYSTFAEDWDLKGFVINHKDGNKLNNNFHNLEKISYQENNLHAEYIINTHKSAKSVSQYDLEDNKIQTFRSVAEATRKTKINCISRAARKGWTAGGYKWKYE